MNARTDTVIKLEDYRPTPYSVASVHLDVDLRGTETTVTSRCRFEPREGTAAGTPLVLNGDELTLTGIRLDGAPLDASAYEASPGGLTLSSPPAVPFTLEVDTKLDPAANTRLEGLYRSSKNYCTQCEAEGFRRITYYYDRPDVLSVYTVRIEGDRESEPVLLANGNLVEKGDLDDGRHFAVWNDPHPKPSYLFAMVAGDLARVSDTFTTMSGRKVDLHIYVEHGNESRCDYAMDALKRSMAWDEERFGREYDLDIFMIVAVSDFNMGAMENKGLNIFNDKYVLADPASATDQDYQNIESIIAHEYFHNWTGNRITCRDWFQLCLKEGLTVFRDQEFSADTRSRPVQRIGDVNVLKLAQFPEDSGPLAHPVRPREYHEINNFYTATVYEKGAEIVRMLTAVLGADGFSKGMNLYFERHDGDAATIEDFLACFADATGTDLRQFSLWYDQSGTPSLAVTSKYDSSSRELSLSVEQSCPPTPGQETKAPYHIPVRFGLVGPNGEDLQFGEVSGAEMTGDVLHITKPRQDIVIKDVAVRPVPSLLRRFSAPVNLTSNLTLEDRLFLIRHDSDDFNRWQAIQTSATEFMIAGVDALASGRNADTNPAFLDALGEVCGSSDLDPDFRALALRMPSEVDLAREIGQDIDPDAIFAARLQMRRDILAANYALFERLYRELEDTGPYSPDAASAGRRSLRNVLLGYLVLGEEPAADATLAAHYNAAGNMTDLNTAMGLAAHMELPSGAEIVRDFHDRFCADPLNLDKWFSAQASAPHQDTLDKIGELMKHPGFSLTNPNRVRSVISAFASGNRTQFNRPDGAGFRFVADTILRLDKSNPQIAARLATSFRSWRALEPVRRKAAQAALETIKAAPELSTDTADIVARTLG